MRALGNKIMIIGNGGTGKSTLAAALAGILKIPVYHLDRLAWKPGWQKVPYEEFEIELRKIIAKDAWIIDGWSYNQSMDLRLKHCTAVIFLDLPYWRCISNVLKRQAMYAFRPNPYYPDNSPVLGMTFYVLKAVRRVHREYLPSFRKKLKNFPGKEVVRMESHAETGAFLNSVRQSLSLLKTES